mgnify:CR=1 FL=1
MTIHIAIAGHANVGKTTLIRTFTRQPIGEVGDLANVTNLYLINQIELMYYLDNNN